MNPIRWTVRRLRAVVARRGLERDMREEMAAHLDRSAERFVARGLSPDEARRAAAREFGNVGVLQEQARDVRGGRWAHGVVADLGFAQHYFARHKATSATIVTVLALGIGSTTAMFALVDAVILRPVAVRDPASVVSVVQVVGAANPSGRSTYSDYVDLAAGARTLQGLAAYHPIDVVAEAGVADMVTAIVTSPNYFEVLGVHAARGRVFDDQATEPVAVIGDGYWRRALGADPDVVGRRLRIDGKMFTVIGIAPANFRGTDLATIDNNYQRTPTPCCVWLPATAMGGATLFGESDALTSRLARNFSLVGRLSPRATAAGASEELTAVMGRLRALNAVPNAALARAGAPAIVMSAVPVDIAAAGKERDALVIMVRLLFVSVLLLLLLACASVANLLLARGADRAGELMVRMALGASRSRVVRQLIIESSLMALIAAVVGLAIAKATISLVSAFALPGGVRVGDLNVGLDGRIVSCSLVLAVATAMLFGVWPAVSATRSDIGTVLKSHGARAARSGPRDVLLSLQVAISLVLLTGALLFVRSLRAAFETNIGFDPRGLAAVTLSPGLSGASMARSAQIYDDVLERVRGLPGVTGASVASHVPLSRALPLPLSAVGAPVRAQPSMVNFASVSPGYFELLRVPIVAGRDFATTDAQSSRRVAVINESAAALFWPHASPIGHEIALLKARRYTVVGVVRDSHYQSLLERGSPFVYGLMDQDPFGAGVSVIARSADPDATTRDMVAAVRSLDASLPVLDPRTVSAQVDRVLMPQRIGATLLTTFAVVAIGVWIVGLYGSIAYTVSRRTSEIGIRVALGAGRKEVLLLVAGGAGLAVLAGGVIGLGASAIGSAGLTRFLYGVSRLDPVTFGSAILAVIGIGGLVMALPARRALVIEPAQALRGVD